MKLKIFIIMGSMITIYFLASDELEFCKTSTKIAVGTSIATTLLNKKNWQDNSRPIVALAPGLAIMAAMLNDDIFSYTIAAGLATHYIYDVIDLKKSESLLS